MRLDPRNLMPLTEDQKKQLAHLIEKMSTFALNSHNKKEGHAHYDPILRITIQSLTTIDVLKSIRFNLDDYQFPNPVIFSPSFARAFIIL